MNIRFVFFFIIITLFKLCLHQVHSRIQNFTLMEKQKLEQIYILNPVTTIVNINFTFYHENIDIDHQIEEVSLTKCPQL